jgi:hypothetical protein
MTNQKFSVLFIGIFNLRYMPPHITILYKTVKNKRKNNCLSPVASLSQTGEGSPLAPFYSESNMKVLMKSIKQLKKGKGVEHELIEA